MRPPRYVPVHYSPCERVHIMAAYVRAQLAIVGACDHGLLDTRKSEQAHYDRHPLIVAALDLTIIK